MSDYAFRQGRSEALIFEVDYTKLIKANRFSPQFKMILAITACIDTTWKVILKFLLNQAFRLGMLVPFPRKDGILALSKGVNLPSRVLRLTELRELSVVSWDQFSPNCTGGTKKSYCTST